MMSDERKASLNFHSSLITHHSSLNKMHIPVLLPEAIDGLNPEPGETFIDGTLGNGGHAKALTEKLGKGGWLIGIDQDESSLAGARKNLADAPCRVSFVLGNFRKIAEIAKAEGIDWADGILLDIGFSSNQLESSGKGFSFLRDEPLDMRMGEETKFTAAEMVNDWDEANLADVIYGYGEETAARAIARGIVAARRQRPIKTTGELVEAIRQALPVPLTKKRLHFATKTFQALRIAVNDELGALKEGMAGAWSVLKSGGRLGIISFHSLEARQIKEFFKEKARRGEGELRPKKVLKASREEILANPRSRSAQLRIIVKN
ncbi:MAG: 16S rRNA (cytosine(1402)-N(4))-methyltransferase RsmH [Candidatus Vogelbacteria bacterium]|nr:16S rRNA (cytosine(1402)-N(4))-methyltransferase RsmH [Candidatus Vogelbacteria bacterium]